MFPLRLTCD
jgi:hypothetical protein